MKRGGRRRSGVPARNLGPGFELRRAPQNFNAQYLAFVRRRPCCVPGCGVVSDPHHTAGRARDLSALPLCRAHHEECHAGRAVFAAKYNLNLCEVLVATLQAFISGDDFPAF